MRVRVVLAALALAALAVPAHGQMKSAISAKEKLEICKFGAKDQGLAGADERDFIRRCMADEDAPGAQAKKGPPTKK